MILQRSAVRHPAAIPGVQPQISFKYSVSFFTKGPPRESAGANPDRDTVPGNRNTFSAQVNQVSTNCALRVSAKLLTTRELCGTIHSLVGECLRCVLQRPWGHIPLKGAMQLCRPCRCLNQYTGNQRQVGGELVLEPWSDGKVLCVDCLQRLEICYGGAHVIFSPRRRSSSTSPRGVSSADYVSAWQEREEKIGGNLIHMVAL